MSQHEKYLNLSFWAVITIIAGIFLFFAGLYKVTENRSFSPSHATENIPSMTMARPSRPTQKTAYSPLTEGREIATLVFAAYSSPDITAVTDLVLPVTGPARPLPAKAGRLITATLR